MGYPDNKILDAYYHNIGLQTEEAIEANPVGTTIRYFMGSRMKVLWKGCYNSSAILEFIGKDKEEEEQQQRWYRGTFSKLLKDLETAAQQLNINTSSKLWPKLPNYLSRRLNEVKTNLREIGITVEKFTDVDNNTRLVEICKVSYLSPVSPEVQNQAQKQPKNTRDKRSTGGIVSPECNVSPEKSGQNRAQNNNSGDTYDTGDTLHILPIPLTTANTAVAITSDSESYECYYCNVFTPTFNRQEYENHIVRKHFGKNAYPSKFELERLGIEPKGKSWE
jgi:hypothetical protein